MPIGGRTDGRTKLNWISAIVLQQKAMSEVKTSEFNGASATRSESKTSDKGVCWSITINNPSPQDLDEWERLRALPWVRSTSGQMEEGEQGTQHLQGMVRTHSVRFSQVKKALPRAHIEKARSEAALAKYVVKEDTRLSALPATKVATVMDVQRDLYSTTCLFLRIIPIETTSTQLEEAIEEAETQTRLQQGRNYTPFAKRMFDRAVSSLIRRGYYGVEFVCANNQVRTAFISHFSSIIIREHEAFINRHSQTQNSPPEVHG